jgi:mRNA-degrading endonuclease YafQ of YafQ-DinJ toxin-antitoxin module
MKRTLLRSSAFIRAAKQFLKKHPSLVDDLQTTLTFAFHPKLKTHKLKDNLIGLWHVAVVMI